VTRLSAALVLVATLQGLAACGSQGESVSDARPVSTAGRLVLAIKSAQTAEGGRSCTLDVMARNDTGAGALNVQAAWMAQTEGFGIISDYQMLGDFTAGEERALRLSVVGAPCTAVRELKLTRAVCAVAPLEEPPRSCADRVLLDGGGVVNVPR
jgi:hypothetical protein